ncbi:MAG: DUF4870 domain-containing protein [Flavobacteriaceae bacterium]|nr:DUF4870 domain-containing protein [Bacteroidia bacterium]NNK27270.1 DUF4870 domain-containing protein [Flavobacteriaceae bacterium]NNL62091.1 DUF4870 domain-containing protein [Flavobacteriaceae bacterium]
MRKDNQLLVITHLSQLLDFITGFGGLIVPFVLWLTQKDRVWEMDEHGKSILNFQISICIYTIICIPLIFALGLGILGLILIGIIALVFPIVNAVRASNGEPPKYPLSLNFIS